MKRKSSEFEARNSKLRKSKLRNSKLRNSKLRRSKPPSSKPRARSFGGRSSELGRRTLEFGARNSEFGVRCLQLGARGSDKSQHSRASAGARERASAGALQRASARAQAICLPKTGQHPSAPWPIPNKPPSPPVKNPLLASVDQTSLFSTPWALSTVVTTSDSTYRWP